MYPSDWSIWRMMFVDCEVSVHVVVHASCHLELVPVL